MSNFDIALVDNIDEPAASQQKRRHCFTEQVVLCKKILMSNAHFDAIKIL